MVYLLNCEYRFCDSRKSDKCFLVFAKFAKVMNVLSVLRIMQKWHAETREGPIYVADRSRPIRYSYETPM